MLEALKNEANLTLTENGALAYRSTKSACLDLFAVCGALRQTGEKEIIRKFMRAYTEDPDTAMRILFYARDVRGGLGERRFFNIIVRHLADFRPTSVTKNLPLFAEYGRYDDTLSLLGTKCETNLAKLIRRQLDVDLAAAEDGKSVSLLAKWLPSINTSSPWTREHAKQLCRLLGMKEKEYRRTLSTLRRHIGIVEDSLRRKDYTFDYEKVPGKALFQYRHTMWRNDTERYETYIKEVRAGKASMNAGTLYPYEIVRAAMHEHDPDALRSLDAAWNALPDYTDSRNALAVIDGSGSMYMDYGGGILPITVAVSLGIYFAERNCGHFANHFITFSRTPRLVELKTKDIASKIHNCMWYNEIANTDLYEVFMLILITAVKHNLPQSELPELLYIISDMEFDMGLNPDETVFEDAKEKFEEYGYKLPQVVYWNVAARNEQYPITMNEKGAALVSGASPMLFSQMMAHDFTPISLMEQVLNSDRYKNICA